MNHVPRAFAALRAREAEAAKTADAQAQIVREQREKEEHVLLTKIDRALAPYHQSQIDNYFITVRPQIGKSIAVYFDSIHWLTFRVQRHFYRCACEAPCDCKPNTWITMQVIQHRSDNGFENYQCYFPCGEDQIDNEDTFAYAMSQMLKDLKWEQRRRF